jgi:hypothetical protein
VEAHTVSGQGQLGNVPGSPAVDNSGVGGFWVWFDPVHEQVIASESNSNSLGLFGAKGGAFTVLGHTAVAGGTYPGPMAQLGAVLFVATGTVDACALGRGTATCMLAVVLPGASARTGIGVL